MAGKHTITLLDMFRTVPVRSALFTLLPTILALGQLGNSIFNDVSMIVSVVFALVIVGYAGVLTQHSFAQFRRRKIEGELVGLR